MKATKIKPTEWPRPAEQRVTAPFVVSRIGMTNREIRLSRKAMRREDRRKIPRGVAPTKTGPSPGSTHPRIRVNQAELKPMSDAERERRRIFVYADRNRILRAMGFLTYADYINSDLWNDIRQRVLRRDQRRCCACLGPARQVHHLDYEAETLRGDSLDGLTTICDPCHTDAEFDPDGRKRGLWAANAVLARVMAMTRKDRARLQMVQGWRRKAAKLERRSLRNYRSLQGTTTGLHVQAMPQSRQAETTAAQ